MMSILSEIQSKLKAPKSQMNKFGGYKYRSTEDIVEAVKPLLAEHGCHLNITDEIVGASERVYVKATASIMMDDKVVSQASACAREPLERKGMDASQITGATSSYARKYALNGLLAIDDTKDADTFEQMAPEPINQGRVDGCYDMFMEVMKEDVDNHDFARMQNGYNRLTNDEQIAVFDKIGTEKIPNSRKGYKSLAKDLLAMSEADNFNPNDSYKGE